MKRKRLILILVLILSFGCKPKENKVVSKTVFLSKTINVDFATSLKKGAFFIAPESISFLFQGNIKIFENIDSIQVINPLKITKGYLRVVSKNTKDSTLTSHFSAKNYGTILGITNRPKNIEDIDSLYHKISNLKCVIKYDTISYNILQDKMYFNFLNNNRTILYEKGRKSIIKENGMILNNP